MSANPNLEILHDNPKSFWIWRKTTYEKDTHALNFYPKNDVSWETMNAWLEANYKDSNRFRWKWMGFGKIGTDEFSIVVLKCYRSMYDVLEEGDEGYNPDESDDEEDDEDEEDVPSFDDEEGITTPLRDGLRKEDTEGDWWEARDDTWYRV